MNTKQIATDILNQLGGNKFLAMTGAKNLVALENGLQFSFKGSKIATNCVIKLGDTFLTSDLYTVEFWKINAKAGTCTKVAEYEGIYNDMLQSLFTENTGLDTRL